MHVDRRAVGFQREFDDIHCPHYPSAEKPRGLTLRRTFPFVAVSIVVLMI